MSNKLNIAIAGLGTVGAGVVKVINKNKELIRKRCGKEIVVTAVSSRSKNKDRGIDVSNISWYDNAVDIANDKDVDVVVELIGGDSGVAYELCEKSLKAGKSFVTANKALIAKHGHYFAKLAEENNVSLMFEAAVAGGIPVIKSLKEGLAANQISKVSGILNGTCNYMITAMSQTSRNFDVILKEAQDLGYAEADPSFDIDGIDAAHKLAILSSIAFGGKVDFDQVYIEGIRKISLTDVKYAEELGYKIKLLGLASINEKGVKQRVCPCLISQDYPVAKVDGVNNAVFIEGDTVGKIVLEGPGAGQDATASAVMSDIIDIAQERKSFAFGQKSEDLVEQKFIDISDHESEYYFRITVEDKPGVLSEITNILKQEGLSMKSILQKATQTGEKADIVGITHNIIESKIKSSIEKIEKLDSVIGSSNLIRIESA